MKKYLKVKYLLLEDYLLLVIIIISTNEVKNNGGLFAGINDQITTRSHPETTFYNIMDARPTEYTNFDTWQEFLKAKQFDIFAQKDFKSLLTCNKELAIKSNGTSIGEAKIFWDSTWNITNIKGEYNIDMSSNFKYKDPVVTNLVIGLSTLDYSKISQKYMSAILNFNSGSIFSINSNVLWFKSMITICIIKYSINK